MSFRPHQGIIQFNETDRPKIPITKSKEFPSPKGDYLI